MKLLRYGEPGQERPGLLDEQGGVRDLGAHVSDIGGATLTPEGLAFIAALDASRLPLVEAPRTGPCVGGVGKIVCIGLNYADHAEEAGMERPKEPVIFLKATSSLCGAEDDIVLPSGARRCDWEVELGLVVGKSGSHIPAEAAMEHIAGFCVLNDISERSYQIKRGGQWTKGKSCDTFCPLGPWLVTRDEIQAPEDLSLWLEVDGERMQAGSTRDMIFPLAHIVSYVSNFMSLHPGDVIATGTPAGVGMSQKPPRFLGHGMLVRAGIAHLGIQTQRVVASETLQ